LRKYLATKKKHNKHGKRLHLHQEGEYHRGTEWCSLRKFSEALEREKRKERPRKSRKDLKKLR
jgi:hypothetical protein